MAGAMGHQWGRHFPHPSPQEFVVAKYHLPCSRDTSAVVTVWKDCSKCVTFIIISSSQQTNEATILLIVGKLTCKDPVSPDPRENEVSLDCFQG